MSKSSRYVCATLIEGFMVGYSHVSHIVDIAKDKTLCGREAPTSRIGFKSSDTPFSAYPACRHCERVRKARDIEV